MRFLQLLFFIVVLAACKEPVPVEDIYQSEKDKVELQRQEKARVGADGLTAVGCPPDDTVCIADKAREALKKLDD